MKEHEKMWQDVFDEHVPGEGAAKTLFGELVRCINKLDYRFYNDGDRVSDIFTKEEDNQIFAVVASAMCIADNAERLAYNGVMGYRDILGGLLDLCKYSKETDDNDMYKDGIGYLKAICSGFDEDDPEPREEIIAYKGEFSTMEDFLNHSSEKVKKYLLNSFRARNWLRSDGSFYD
jgi:hypothetical protein